MLNIFLHWGTIQWKYVSRGFVSYYLVVYVYMRTYVMLGNNPQSVMSVEDLLYKHTITDVRTYIFCYFIIANSAVVHFSS